MHGCGHFSLLIIPGHDNPPWFSCLNVVFTTFLDKELSSLFNIHRLWWGPECRDECHTVVYAWVIFIYQIFYKYMLLFYIL